VRRGRRERHRTERVGRECEGGGRGAKSVNYAKSMCNEFVLKGSRIMKEVWGVRIRWIASSKKEGVVQGEEGRV
jgi:hypothetical protein